MHLTYNLSSTVYTKMSIRLLHETLSTPHTCIDLCNP